MPGFQWEARREPSSLLKDVQTSLCHGNEAVPGQHRLPTSAEVPLVLLQNVWRKRETLGTECAAAQAEAHQ